MKYSLADPPSQTALSVEGNDHTFISHRFRCYLHRHEHLGTWNFYIRFRHPLSLTKITHIKERMTFTPSWSEAFLPWKRQTRSFVGWWYFGWMPMDMSSQYGLTLVDAQYGYNVNPSERYMHRDHAERCCRLRARQLRDILEGRVV